MKNLSIESLTLDEFKVIVNEIVSSQLKEHLKKEENKIQFITRKEAAKLLCCSLNTLDDWTLKGYIKANRFGSTVRYLKHEIEQAGQTIIRRRKRGGGNV